MKSKERRPPARHLALRGSNRAGSETGAPIGTKSRITREHFPRIGLREGDARIPIRGFPNKPCVFSTKPTLARSMLEFVATARSFPHLVTGGRSICGRVGRALQPGKLGVRQTLNGAGRRPRHRHELPAVRGGHGGGAHETSLARKRPALTTCALFFCARVCHPLAEN